MGGDGCGTVCVAAVVKEEELGLVQTVYSQVSEMATTSFSCVVNCGLGEQMPLLPVSTCNPI